MKRLNFKSVTPTKLKGAIDGPNWYSGKGQDSIINHIFQTIDTTNKFCIEFGATDFYDNSNTLYLAETGWTRLGFDLVYDNPSINLHKVRLTKENICEVFSEHNVPLDLDFISIDVDGNDYWLLDSLLQQYSPRVVMTEINSRFEAYENKIMKYDPNYCWDGHSWYGASAYAFKLLAESYDYTLVHTFLDEAFLIRNDCLSKTDKNIPWEQIYQPCMEIYIGTDPHINNTNYI